MGASHRLGWHAEIVFRSHGVEIAAVTWAVVPLLVVQIPMVRARATLTIIAAAIMALVNWRIFIRIFSRFQYEALVYARQKMERPRPV